MTFRKKMLSGIAIAAAVVVTAGVAGSQTASSSNPAVAARHAEMQLIGYHIGVLGAIAKGEMEYSAEMVDAAAKNLQTLAGMEKATLWVAGTEQGAVDGSRAKAEIWSDPEGFAKGFDDLQMASAAMVGAADAAAVGAGMGAIGGTCQACHEKYRGPKNGSCAAS